MDIRLVPALKAAEAAVMGCSPSARIVRNVPVPCRWNWAPTNSMYFGEFRKQYKAECNGMSPLPPAT